MPALAPPNLFFDLAGRTIANSTTLEPVQVVCSWPLSGQYGVGSRLLYYVLVAACVLARKSEWLRNACLAAALILPAIAAIHAIVLAALHVDDAIDLDIYGALQLCSIGILTAPACVRLSNTYFNSKGRNVLFLWTILVLAGLLALTVEFFRSQSKPCLDDGFGRPLYPGFDFPYDNTTCGLTCTVKDGPFSPMRDGSADNIYVVPVPFVLKFGAATLVAAASCIPGILSTVSIWNKIVKTNSVKRFGAPNADEVIEGTNGATIQGMKSVNNLIRRLLSVVEVPVFGGAVLALIIFGELNFWSKPLHFQSEPPTNIGQWSNICASAFAACGSLYMLLVKYLERVEEEGSMHDDLSHCHCTCHEHGSLRPRSISDTSEMAETSRPPAAVMADDDVRVFRHDTAPAYMLSPTRTETCPDTEEALRGLGIHPIDSNTSTAAASGVTKALVKLATSFGTTSSGRFDDNAFRQGKVTGFPEIPGELNRNSRLNQIKQQWGEPNTDIEDGLTPRGRRSRANSFNGSISRANSIGPRAPSPNPPPRSPTTGPGTSILDLPTTHSPESTSEPIFPSRPSAEGEKPRSQGTVVTLHEGPNSPAIVLSSDDEPGDWPEPAGTMSGSTEQHSEHTEIPTKSGGLSVPTEGKRDASAGMTQHGAQHGVQEQQEALPADGQHESTGEVHVQAPPPTSEEAK